VMQPFDFDRFVAGLWCFDGIGVFHRVSPCSLRPCFWLGFWLGSC
jgi:hypothetical protein